MMDQCSGSGLVLDAPASTTHLPCPNCGAKVKVDRPEVPNGFDNDQWVLQGHRDARKGWR